MNGKTAIIISGGGMAASYGVGCILALVHKYGFTDPDIIIAGSGSSGTMSYYVSKQYNSIKNIRSNLLCTKKFINYFRINKIINIDYLIDVVFKKQDTLDVQKIYNSKTIFLIPVTNRKTGKVNYFGNNDNVDFFEVMRAAKSMPLFFGKKVYIQNGKFFDSPNSSGTELHIQKAIQLGAKNIIIIDNQQKTPYFLVKAFLLQQTIIFKKNFLQEYNIRKFYTIPGGINTIVLKPKSKLKIGLLQNKKTKIDITIDHGYNDTKDNKELSKFINYFIK